MKLKWLCLLFSTPLLLLATYPVASARAALALPPTAAAIGGEIPINSTAVLRATFERPPADGRMSLLLRSGVYKLTRQLRVHRIDVSLRGEGEGATIDAQGFSRHFDVALGGRLHLERVHLINGGSQASGGTALVRHGGTLSTVSVCIEDSIAADTGGAVASYDTGMSLVMLNTTMVPEECMVSDLAFSPDGTRIVSACQFAPTMHMWNASGA